MDNPKKSSPVEDNYVSKIFSEYKNELNKVTDNKYFDLTKESSVLKTGSAKKDSKAKIEMNEWFEGLSTTQRAEAVSTIFDKNNKVLQHIKTSLDKIVSLSKESDCGFTRIRPDISSRSILTRRAEKQAIEFVTLSPDDCI